MVVAANTHTTREQEVSILVDRHLNGHGVRFTPVFSNRPAPADPDAVVNNGQLAGLRVHLRPMEAMVLAKEG
jgi:hypothetical protein